MSVKYICQKCSKRFVDWGAEKLGYRCPDCEDAELVRASEHEAAKPRKAKPTLKRKPRKKAAATPKKEDPESEVPEVIVGEDSTADLLLTGDDDDDDGDVDELEGLSITEEGDAPLDDDDAEQDDD